MSQEIFEEFTSTFPICSVNLTSCICREVTLESLKHEAPCFLIKGLKHRLSLRASRCLRAGKVLATRNETSRTLAPKKKARCQWPMSVILAGRKASETDHQNSQQSINLWCLLTQKIRGVVIEEDIRNLFLASTCIVKRVLTYTHAITHTHTNVNIHIIYYTHTHREVINLVS